MKGKSTNHPLIGAGVHRKENGIVQSQAKIVALIPSNGPAGDLALLQFFEWFSGEPSTKRLIALTEMASTEDWVLYSSVEEMNDHYERVDRHLVERAPEKG